MPNRHSFPDVNTLAYCFPTPWSFCLLKFQYLQMKYRFQSIPNWDVCCTMREIGFCLPAESARKAVLGNYVFRVTPWRIDRLCTHVILINLPRQPLFHFANCTLAGLHNTWCVVRLSCSGSPFLPALWWTLVSNSQEDRSPATSKWKTRTGPVSSLN